MKLREYVKSYKPPNSFLKAGSVCKDRVEVRREAEVLVQAINVWAE
jgi:hypothetical protein